MQMPEINMNTMLYGTWYKISEEIVEALWGNHIPVTGNPSQARFGLVDLTLFPLLSLGIAYIGARIWNITSKALGDSANWGIKNYLLAAGPAFVCGILLASSCVLQLLRALTVVILSLPLVAMSLLMVPAFRLGYQAGIHFNFYKERSGTALQKNASAYGDEFKIGSLLPSLR